MDPTMTIAIIFLFVSVMTLAFSTYGLGKEEGNKSGPAYQAATAFSMIGASGIIISLFVLVYPLLPTKTGTTSSTTSG